MAPGLVMHNEGIIEIISFSSYHRHTSKYILIRIYVQKNSAPRSFFLHFSNLHGAFDPGEQIRASSISTIFRRADDSEQNKTQGGNEDSHSISSTQKTGQRSICLVAMNVGSNSSRFYLR